MVIAPDAPTYAKRRRFGQVPDSLVYDNLTLRFVMAQLGARGSLPTMALKER
jgi:hypothetical protein